jgi:sarcosine oxidase subunit gamma
MSSPVAQELARKRGPLDGRALPSSEAFKLWVAPLAARFIVRGDADIAAIAGATFGAKLLLTPCRADIFAGRAALWLGPDEWLLIAEGEEPEPIAASLGAALAPREYSLVDVSQRQIGLELEGALLARALNAGCPLDVREVSFPVGMATRTMIAKVEAVVWRRGQKRFHVEIGRSFADYAATFLSEAALRACA